MLKCSIYNNLLHCPEGGFEIYNSMTKARIAIDDKNYLEKVITNGSDDVTMRILIDNGFLVDEALDEVSALKYAYNKKFFNASALGIIMLPTMACNFDCPYCFEKPSAHMIRKEVPDYFRAVENYIRKQAPRFRHVYLNFFGGEPLLKRQEIESFTQHVRELSDEVGFSVKSSIVTNGSLLNESVMQSLLRVNCNLIQITIDGAKSQHDKTRIFKSGEPSFDLLIDKIKFAASYVAANTGLRVLIRFNLNNTSIDGVEETLRHFDPGIRKYISLLFRPVYETREYHQANSNHYDELDLFNALGQRMGFQIYKNKRTHLSCEACGDTNVIHILPDLSLWKCVNDISFEAAKMGTLNEDGDAEWDTNRVLAWYRYADFLQDEKCKGCSLSPDCLGGCIRNYILTGKHRCGSLEALSSPYRY